MENRAAFVQFYPPAMFTGPFLATRTIRASYANSIISRLHVLNPKLQLISLCLSLCRGAAESCFPVGGEVQLTGLAPILLLVFPIQLIGGKHEGRFCYSFPERSGFSSRFSKIP